MGREYAVVQYPTGLLSPERGQWRRVWFVRLISWQFQREESSEAITAAPAAGNLYHFNFQRRRRRALPMTMTSEKPIAAAQITGLMKPSAARGMEATL